VVTLERTDAGFRITRIHLDTRARVPHVDPETFQEIANRAKNGCPVSNLYKGAEITLSAQLL
jgi:osmotically inducible protein OsmC